VPSPKQGGKQAEYLKNLEITGKMELPVIFPDNRWIFKYPYWVVKYPLGGY
jgi:hypothetical protein